MAQVRIPSLRFLFYVKIMFLKVAPTKRFNNFLLLLHIMGTVSSVCVLQSGEVYGFTKFAIVSWMTKQTKFARLSSYIKWPLLKHEIFPMGIIFFKYEITNL